MAFVISEVSICNQALVELGANTITTLTEQTSEAIACNNIFANLRRELLMTHPWSFAKKQVELAQSTTTPVFDYDYKYALPADLLYLAKVREDVNYKRLENFIATDKDSCKIEYIYDNEDVSTWSSAFVAAFVAALRWKLAYNITGSGSEAERSRANFQDKLSYARTQDAQNSITDEYAQYDHTLLGSRY